MINFNRILLIKYLDKFGDVVGVDIIGFHKGQSEHIASIHDFDEALNWANRQNTIVQCMDEWASYHEDTPLFNLYESNLFLEN